MQIRNRSVVTSCSGVIVALPLDSQKGRFWTAGIANSMVDFTKAWACLTCGGPLQVKTLLLGSGAANRVGGLLRHSAGRGNAAVSAETSPSFVGFSKAWQLSYQNLDGHSPLPFLPKL